VNVAVAFLLTDGTLDTELETTLETGVLVATLPDAGAGVAEAPDELFTAGPTSGCLPDAGSVLSPQLEPAELSVLPYMRQML
jgi:hypothetical protein